HFLRLTPLATLRWTDEIEKGHPSEQDGGQCSRHYQDDQSVRHAISLLQRTPTLRSEPNQLLEQWCFEVPIRFTRPINRLQCETKAKTRPTVRCRFLHNFSSWVRHCIT